LKKLIFHCGQLLVLFALSVFFQACEPDEGIGIEVQPQGDKIVVGFGNNSGITCYTVPEDSVRSDETLINLMGSYFDPVFGTSTASFCVQFRLPDNDVDFGTNPVADSLVLSLVYNGYYGDISTAQTVKVYEVNEDFNRDSAYYSNDHVQYLPTPIASHFFVPAPNDSLEIGGVNYAPQLRFRLDNAFAQKFINASGTPDLANNTNFLAFFKGLYVTAEPSLVNGAILYFSLLNSLSCMTLYYHNADVDKPVHGMKYTFVINDNSARVNMFDHYGYSGADHDFQHQLAGDTLRGSQILYLQAMAGVKCFLRFPDIENLFGGEKVVINKAELILPIDANLNNQYARPAQLTLIKIGDDGTLSFLPDEYYGSSYFGGTYNSATGDYRFNIATFIQNCVLNDNYQEKGLYLAISGASVNGSRLVLNGPAAGANNLRLEIIYTKIH
jgi:hypothetical protein